MWLNKLVLCRMEQENQLYNRTSSGADFFRKSAPFFSLVAIFSFFLSVFVFAQPAAAQQTMVCDGYYTGSPTPQCISVPAGSAIFPPGSTAPPQGSNLDAVNVPRIPVGDQSLVPTCMDPPFCTSWSVGSVLSPMAPIGGDYTTPFNSYGVDVAPGHGWVPCTPDGGYCQGAFPFFGGYGFGWRSQPSNTSGCGNPLVTPCPGYVNRPSIIAPQNSSPFGLERSSCWDPVSSTYFPCGVNQYGFGVPVDPIVFLPDNRAYMWPPNTMVISGGVQRPLIPQGLQPCVDQFCTQTGCIQWDGFGNCINWGPVPCNCATENCEDATCTAWGPSTPTETIFPGDIVMPEMICPDPPDGTPCWPAYDIGCPAGYVARQYNADGTFNCLDMQAVMDATPPGDCEASVVGCIDEPDPFDPGTCTGPGCMTGPGSGLLPSLCDSSSFWSGFMSFLTGGIDPCDLTFDQLGLGYADQGGEQFAAFIGDWAQDVFLPDMRDMTTQWNVAILDQTLSLLQGEDAANQIRTQGLLQDQQMTAMRNYAPSENTCAMASVSPDLGRGLQAARATKTAILQESANRSLGAAGSGAEEGLRVYHRTAWEHYCNIFANEDENLGVTLGCTGHAGTPGDATDPDLRGADVSVERFLFRDTIDLHNENERIAAEAILKNLVDSSVAEPMSIAGEGTTQYRQQIRRRNHYTTLRQVVVEPVAGIIARRAAVRDSGYRDSVQAMRTAAGIPTDQQHEWPSYNEALLARSKEYFMNLDTLLKTNTDLGALRQDQLVNEALIAILLEDISELEEQINMLLQARASMTFNAAEGQRMDRELDLRPSPSIPVVP